jgi:hypothetical protein
MNQNLPNGLKICDICFISPDTGFVAAKEIIGIIPPLTCNYYIYKTTNQGYNWTQIWSYLQSSNAQTNFSISFSDYSHGLVSYDDKIGKLNFVTNDQYDYTETSVYPTTSRYHRIRYAHNNSNIAYAIFNGSSLFKPVNERVYKTTNNGNNWSSVYEISYTSDLKSMMYDIDINSTNSNEAWVCGFEQRDSPDYVPKIWSNTSGSWRDDIESSYDPIINYYIQKTSSCIYTCTFTGIYNDVHGYNKYPYNSVTVNPHYGFSVSGANIFCAANLENVNGKILVSLNNGTTFSQETDISWDNNYTYGTNISSFNGVAYYGDPGSNNFYTRLPSCHFNSYYNNSSNTISNIIYLNNTAYVTGSNPYLNGGTSSLSTSSYLENDNDVFYRWDDNSLNYINNPYYFDDNDKNISAYFKTKNQSTVNTAFSDPNASNNSPQTRCLQDTIGTIHQIHESIGGIFYSRSTDGGNNFSKEEVVNGGSEYATFLPNEKTADNNSCPSICELRTLNNLARPFGQNDNGRNIAATWQRLEGNQLKLKVAIRNDFGSDIFWRKLELTTNLKGHTDGTIVSFGASSDFKSKPRIFASFYSGFDIYDPYYYLIVVPHLEPSGASGKKIVITTCFEGNIQNFTVADNANLTDFSVTADPTRYNTEYGWYNGYKLHFAYVINNIIYYREDLILGDLGIGDTFGVDQSVIINEEIVSSNDNNQQSRFSPDISLRNGLPIIAYQGYKLRSVPVIINNEDNYITIYDYPILVTYRYTNQDNTDHWSTPIIYNSYGHLQHNPNVEGNRNWPAFIVNFSFDNQYRQYAYLNNGPGVCNPWQFNVTDAKLIRGTFSGSSLPNSSLKLMTLAQSGSLYNISKQSFTVSGGTLPYINDNLVGIIREENTNYSFDLGPVLVRNTDISQLPVNQTSITNFADFNSTMISAPFSLGPGDTLILGGNGYYANNSETQFLEKRFFVNLLRKSNSELICTLFRDTIHLSDSIESEYLRGYVFDRGLGDRDSFYVQLLIDSSSFENGVNYTACNVYSPDEVYSGGDNPHNYKRKVFYKNDINIHNKLTNIPKVYSLSQNYPNPFNPTTTIKYGIPQDGLVTIKIYDLLGRELIKLVNENLKAGYYSATFNGQNFASGIYFYRIQSNNFVQTKKMVLIK